MVNDPTSGDHDVGYGGTTVELFGDVVHAPLRSTRQKQRDDFWR